MSDKVKVKRIPNCDICGEKARFDAKTKNGPWGYLCAECFSTYGIGLGTGLGQELVLEG